MSPKAHARRPPLRATIPNACSNPHAQHFNAALIKAGPDLASVRDALAAAEKGSLVVLDPSMALLDRCWCM